MGRGLTTSAQRSGEMRTSELPASILLAAWERGLVERPVQRALILLAVAYPEWSIEQFRQMPIGQRDMLLLGIREALFGPRMTCLAACPACGEQLEIALNAAQIRALPASPVEDSNGSRPVEWTTGRADVETHTLAEGGFEVQFRLPNSADMLLLEAAPDAGHARRSLFERCVRQATRDGAPVAAGDLPEALVSSIAGRMAQIDPQADIQIALTCPACSHGWSAGFDIVSYLWSEINTWAVRILREVHQIASAYGWREADILALSPMRRQLYLEMIG